MIDFPLCRYCDDTGTYSGPMLGRHYSGPCLMCPDEWGDWLEPEPQRESTVPSRDADPVDAVIAVFDEVIGKNVMLLARCHSACFDDDGHSDGCLFEEEE